MKISRLNIEKYKYGQSYREHIRYRHNAYILQDFKNCNEKKNGPKIFEKAQNLTKLITILDINLRLCRKHNLS